MQQIVGSKMTAAFRAVEVLFTVLQLAPIIVLSIQSRSVHHRLSTPLNQENRKETNRNSLSSRSGHVPSDDTSSTSQHTKEVYP
jgi:hypothetical protein